MWVNTKASMAVYLAVVSGIFGCAGLSKPPKTEVEPLSTGSKNWCNLQKNNLNNLECTYVAGQLELTQFGQEGITSRRLANCIKTEKQETFDFRANKAKIPVYEEDWSPNFKASGGLPLSDVASWLPSVKISGSTDRKLKIKIEIIDASFQRISDPSQVFRSMLNSDLTKQQKEALESCLTILCKDDSYITTEVLVGKPTITFSSNQKIDIDQAIGWKYLGETVQAGSTYNFVLTMTPEPSAPDLVLAARRIRSKAQMVQDKLCINTK